MDCIDAGQISQGRKGFPFDAELSSVWYSNSLHSSYLLQLAGLRSAELGRTFNITLAQYAT